MTGIQMNNQRVQWVGEDWIGSIIEKDFQRLAGICQPEVRSRLMTPKRMDSYENVSDLIQKVESWFHECSSFQKEQSRVAMVGEMLAIFYQLSCEKNGQPCTIEQQLYCTLRDGLIDQLSLLCSGFQPMLVPIEEPIAEAVMNPPGLNSSPLQPSLQVDAFLKVETGGGQGPTCSILTPSIKRKLGEMNSGQVLEVNVDDPSAKEDIEAWSRLSGNSLLKLEQGAGQELHFYLMKK